MLAVHTPKVVLIQTPIMLTRLFVGVCQIYLKFFKAEERLVEWKRGTLSSREADFEAVGSERFSLHKRLGGCGPALVKYPPPLHSAFVACKYTSPTVPHYMFAERITVNDLRM